MSGFDSKSEKILTLRRVVKWGDSEEMREKSFSIDVWRHSVEFTASRSDVVVRVDIVD